MKKIFFCFLFIFNCISAFSQELSLKTKDEILTFLLDEGWTITKSFSSDSTEGYVITKDNAYIIDDEKEPRIPISEIKIMFEENMFKGYEFYSSHSNIEYFQEYTAYIMITIYNEIKNISDESFKFYTVIPANTYIVEFETTNGSYYGFNYGLDENSCPFMEEKYIEQL